MSDAPPLRIFDAKRLLDTGLIRVDEYGISYRRPDGSWSPVQKRYNIDRGNSVAAILFDPETSLLHFVRQFRFSTYDFAEEPAPDNGWLVEIVAGAVDRDETLRDAIVREVREETGFEIAAPALIGSFYLSPGASSERLYLFYAEVSSRQRTRPDKASGYGTEDEEIATVSMTLSEFLGCVERMEISDAKTLAAAEWLRRRK